MKSKSMKIKKMKVSEDQESMALVEWLKIMDLPHHHSANEQPAQKMFGRRHDGKPLWSPNWSTLRRLKNMGVARGFPDYLVWIPKERSRSSKALLLAIEMKSATGKASEDQKRWLETIGWVNDCEGFVCKGADEAIKLIRQFINS